MFKQILVVEKSKIITEGLISILRTHHLFQRVASADFVDACPLVLKGNNPDLVIINPELMIDNPEKLKVKHQFDSHVIMVGLISHYCHKDVIDLFDDVIYVTDQEETIINKLKNLHALRYNTMTSSNGKLTDREKEVLKLLIQGFSNKEVADKLTISPHTVITHRKNIIEKTGIRSLAGLAVYAILNNISEMDDIRN